MRACYKSRNFAALLGLIEEIQSMGNRMESALSDVKDVERMQEQRSDLHKEIKVLKQKKKELSKELGEKEDEDFLEL